MPLALKCMADLDAANPRKCRNYFRALLGIYAAAYKQSRSLMSPDKSFLLFGQSLQGCQTAIDKMTRRADPCVLHDAILRKYLRGLAVVGHKPPTECDSMGTKWRLPRKENLPRTV